MGNIHIILARHNATSTNLEIWLPIKRGKIKHAYIYIDSLILQMN